jgi:hypothetical protein
MSYSIAIRCRSDKLKKKMKKFLKKNYQYPDKLLNFTGSSDFSDKLYYDHTKTALGFNYHPCGEAEHHYIYSVTKWMAIKIGKKRKFKEGTFHYYVFDGFEACPLPLHPHKVKNWYTVNELGFRSMSEGYNKKQQAALNSLMTSCYKLTTSKIDKIIHDGLKRLDKLWK